MTTQELLEDKEMSNQLKALALTEKSWDAYRRGEYKQAQVLAQLSTTYATLATRYS